MQPSLQLSANLLTLPPTAERESISGSVFVKNKSRVAETFEIVVPGAAGGVLKVSPHVGVLAPGQSVRVQVDFCPEATPHPADAAAGAALAAGEGEGEGEEEGAQGAAGGRGVKFGSDVNSRPGSAEHEPAPRCDVWRLPLFRKAGPPPNTS